MAIAGGIGIEADLDALVELRGGAGETCLFGEGPGGIVLAASSERAEAILGRAAEAGIDTLAIGSAGGEEISISAAELDVSIPLADAGRSWRSLAERL